MPFVVQIIAAAGGFRDEDEFVGPFTDEDDADQWMSRHIPRPPYVVHEITHPDYFQPS